ncbi:MULTISPECIES: hypothetical protein [unclassified Mucilaginibacter]|uniref:hypothetical protein n=1 Tax=unclassified Mucilaginibacter TaxID=2617802 RepID=UPI000966E931|nr:MULTISPECIES: hypothetical protein [unclassified Mucilaginibacter]OJW14884.1 MAG: hypothetical protein BGO48_11955 [Mucilaginibacter sp. 44-25]PLW89817.1 MAG: hypothetical protein C0154_09600 [Mucilaginibacter sp.]HEK21701.1 hypothetical protein [Bacteroidota bacterium]
MKKLLYLFLVVIAGAGCHKAIYDMNRGELKIAKKDTYQVEYITEIPPGVKAKMYYIGAKNVQYYEEEYTGKFDKTYTIKSGKEIKFTIDAKLPKTKPEGSIHTMVKVDGEVVTDQTQSGTDINFRFQFKLP